MKKIGIITINDYNNYGNRLQNFACQEVIKNLGFEVETIVNTPIVIDKTYKREKIKIKIKKIKAKDIPNLTIKAFSKIRRKIRLTKTEKKHLDLKKKRKDNFVKFTEKYIKETDFLITPRDVPMDLHENYYKIVAGSDQVWNPNLREGAALDFLTFAPREKRIAYSASFGISKIPETYIENYRNWLNGMAHISVREEAGAKIIKQITGRSVPVLVDPTMMLKREEWLKISSPSNHKPNKKYLLTYFLGDTSKERLEWIKSVAKDNNLEVISMADISEEKYYNESPAEFIDFIKDCYIFCTDSFHGVVFSLIFQKPFVAFDRNTKKESMNSRIDTLLSKFQLEHRKWEEVMRSKDYFEVNFSHVEAIIQEERNKGLQFLSLALNIEDTK